MTIQLSHGPDFRNRVLEGVNTLADYVASTLGPKGQNVLISNTNQTPFVTKDGVTVAENINFEDPVMNAAAQVVKQASRKTNSEAGDGTTTSTVLTREILNQADKYIQTGTSPVELRRGLEQCLAAVIKIIDDLSTPLNSMDDIKHIATISANNDPIIGSLIATAVDKVGKGGAITVEQSRSHETVLDLVEGFRFKSGLAARAFVTDDRRGVCRYENPMFLITDSKISEVAQILPSLEIAAREGRPFVIVAEEIEGQALAALIVNTVRGSMKVAAIKGPGYGESRRETMSDLAIATGAKYFQQSMGHKLEDVTLLDFGQAQSIESDKLSTTVISGAGAPQIINETIEKLNLEIKKTEDFHEAGRIQERVTRLNSGVAIIRVGGSSDVEVTEKRHRVEDALEAVRAAQSSGIVPGGGMTLLVAAERLAINFENEEQAAALSIIKNTLRAPFWRMALNAGLNPSVLIHNLENSGFDHGVDFLTGERINLVEKGIIDPAKVTKCALRNAVSVASTLLLTNHGIVNAVH